MPTSADLANWVFNYFAQSQQHVAEVLAGPKRETWFSSEVFVALGHAAQPLPSNPIVPTFSCWGEQEYTSLLAKAYAQPNGGNVRRRPDVVCYLPQVGQLAVDAVLELKVVLNDENASSELADLKTQLENARQISKSAKVLGLVFFAVAPLTTPGGFEASVVKLRTTMEAIMPTSLGFDWVSGHDVRPVFRTVSTRFHYPSMAVSLALGVRELQ